MTTIDSRSLLEMAQQYAMPGLLVQATLEGLPPGFLMHSATAMKLASEAEAEHRKNGKRTKFIPTPEQEAEWGVYRTADGVLYVPAKSLLRCFVEAAKGFKAPKSRASLRKEAAAGIQVPPTVGLGFPILDGSGKVLRDRDYTVDVQRAVVQRSAIQRARPLVEEWVVEAEFTVDIDALAPEVFAQIVGYAGSRIGIGDNRPERGGPYGRFKVTALEVAVGIEPKAKVAKAKVA